MNRPKRSISSLRISQRPVKVSRLYEHMRVLNTDVADLTVAMQKVTGDASPHWEDTVMSQAANNVVLNTLYRRFKRLRQTIRNLGDQTVQVATEGEDTDDPDAPLTTPVDTYIEDSE